MSSVASAATNGAFYNVSGVRGSASSFAKLDCNGDSPAQKGHERVTFLCTDVHGIPGVHNANTWNGRFYDNGVYIGHDEPDTTFFSDRKSSGNNVSWNFSLGKDPSAAPTTSSPGHDVSHWAELSVAPWLSMAMCDPLSYPQTACTPNSNKNRPRCGISSVCKAGQYPGGGSAFMEMQFYPPGEAPFVDNTSCNNTYWCAALTIDSLSCTENFASCNLGCEEPVNFAFIQKNGVPDTSGGGFVPNNETLMMKGGDKISVHMWDAKAPADPAAHIPAGRAFEVKIVDKTTHQTGYMQASAKNGFFHTSMANCSESPFNWQPEYNTASASNYVPWAALRTNISMEFEIGHFTPCTSLSEQITPNPFDAADTSPVYNKCIGKYESAPEGHGETGDGLCYYKGATHNGYAGPGTKTDPNIVTGCADNYQQNGDIDFDGSAYWKEWPTGPSPTAKYPGSFRFQMPMTNGKHYAQFFMQTDVGLSEGGYGCGTTPGTVKNCTVPPNGPGHFYPYWSEEHVGASCTFFFGNVSGKNISTFGKDKQYGTVKTAWGYPEIAGTPMSTACPPKS